MQTIQASRTYMMCARDKVVDLGEYRRSLADCWSVQTGAPAEPPVPAPPPGEPPAPVRPGHGHSGQPGGGGHDRRLHLLGAGDLTAFGKISPRSQKVFNLVLNFSRKQPSPLRHRVDGPGKTVYSTIVTEL